MNKALTRILFHLSCVACVSCSGGGGEDSQPVGTEACGVLGMNSRIIDGTRCSGASPVVKVYSDQGGSCTGTVVSKRKVVTAAHCVFSIDETQDAFVQIPQNSLTVSTGNETNPIARSRSYTAHPEYLTSLLRILLDLDSKGQLEDPKAFIEAGLNSGLPDIAVIEFNRDLNLPTMPIISSRSVAAEEIVSIFGFGLLQSGGNDGFVPDDVYSGKMRIELLGSENLGAFFENGGSNTCNGDSGGPVVTQEPVTGLVGATSSGSDQDCGKGDLSLFTAVSGPSVLSYLRQVAADATYR
jgi:hypothetical protein